MTKGRPRKPTHLKVVAGTDRPDRRNGNEPTPARERPSPPADLSVKAAAAWGELVTILDGMGVMTCADVFALAALAETVADLRRLRDALARDVVLDPGGGTEPVIIAKGGEPTYVVCGRSGAQVKHRPEVAMIADADRRLQGWLARFGLTPSDRSRVSRVVDPQRDEWDGF
ncbi:P27 family phage terminase small subunit [Niveispirillum sp. KHB5.9]|uniref:P27 family phage terminase small subunit n=1 Tax=Niveispirillum sp. KHB5.9 TaxID=3400269 RepID=UPI003A8C7A8C